VESPQWPTGSSLGADLIDADQIIHEVERPRGAA
jgi:hypothetical protein